MAKDDFWVSADGTDNIQRATSKVKRTPAAPSDDTTTFEDNVDLNTVSGETTVKGDTTLEKDVNLNTVSGETTVKGDATLEKDVDLNTVSGETTIKGNTTVNGYFLCEKGGAVLFPFDEDIKTTVDFGEQLNNFISNLTTEGQVPFTGGPQSVTIQLPEGAYDVETSVVVPNGVFIQGFGATYPSSRRGGTRLRWKGDPNDWDGAPEDDQAPWKGFCFVFRAGYLGGLSYLEIDCSTHENTDPTEPIVKPGLGGVFIGSLNQYKPNGVGPTKQIRLEYVVVRNADIGIQHGNVTRMGANIQITEPANGIWEFKINGGTLRQPNVTGASTEAEVVSFIVNWLNSGTPKPVDDDEVFTVNHGDNFDIVARDPSEDVELTDTLPASPGTWEIRNNDAEERPHTPVHMQADFCEFHHCMVVGMGSKGMLLNSANNDLSVIDTCVFVNADMAIDIQNAGSYELRNVTCDVRPHMKELFKSDKGATDTGDILTDTTENFYYHGVRPGDTLELYDNTPDTDDKVYVITDVNKNSVEVDPDWPSGNKINQKYRIKTSYGGVGVNVPTNALRRFSVDGYNQEQGLLAFKFFHESSASSTPVMLSRYPTNLPFLIVNTDGAKGVGSYRRPFKFVDSMIFDLVVKGSGANVLLDSSYVPSTARLCVEGASSTIKLLNCYCEPGYTRSVLGGARFVDRDAPSLSSDSGRLFRPVVSDNGSTGTEEITALYYPMDLYFDKGTGPVAYKPICSYIGRQVEGDGGGSWPAEAATIPDGTGTDRRPADTQHRDIEILDNAAGDWELRINYKTCTYKALDFSGQSKQNIANGLAKVIAATVPEVHVEVKASSDPVVRVYAVTPGVELDIKTMSKSTNEWEVSEQLSNAILKLASTGVAPSMDSNFEDTYREPADEGVQYGDVQGPGKVHQAQYGDIANITTGDFVFEMLFKTPSDKVGYIAAKRVTTTGWAFALSGGEYPQFVIDDGSSKYVQGPETLDASTWYHYMVFCDRDQTNSSYFLRMYEDGNRLSSTAGATGATGSIGNTEKLTFAARSDLSVSTKERGGIALFRVWTASDMFPGGEENLVQWDQVAKARYDILASTVDKEMPEGRLFTISGFRKGTVGENEVTVMEAMDLPRAFRVLSAAAYAGTAPGGTNTCTIELTDGTTSYSVDIIGSSHKGNNDSGSETPLQGGVDVDITMADDDSLADTADVFVTFVCQEI